MANKFWLGSAGGNHHAYTITLANTWAAADSVSATINGKPVTVTVATGETSTNEVAGSLCAAINAANATAGLVGEETRNVGGQEYPEFRELTATCASSVVTVRHDTIGIPFVLTATEVTAGSGTATAAVSVTATGPHHADNAANWSGGALPADGDTLVFNEGNSSCSYGLHHFRDATKKISLLRTTDYTGSIGLPATNPGGYAEYRDRFLEMYDTTDAFKATFETGDRMTTGGPPYLDMVGSTYASLFARDVGAIVQGRPNLQIHGGTVSDMYLGNGSFLIDPDDANVTTGMTIDALNVDGTSDQSTLVTFGRNTAWANAGTAGTFRDGTVVFECAIDQGTPLLTITQLGGMLHARGDGDLGAATIKGGTFHWEADGDAAGVMNIWGDATLDLRGDGRARAFSGTLNVYQPATVWKGGHTPTLTPLGCTLEDCKIFA